MENDDKVKDFYQDDDPFSNNPEATTGGGENFIKFDEKKYVNTKLPKGVKSDEICIRILPAEPKSNHPKKIYSEVDLHAMMVDTEISKSGFKNFNCLNDISLYPNELKAKEEWDANERKLKSENSNYQMKPFHRQYHDNCPLCNQMKLIHEEANKIPDNESERKRAMFREGYKYQPKKAYIIRCIQRGKEEDGVKFMRFNARTDGKGILDQLMSIYKLRKAEHEKAGINGYNVFDLNHGHDITLTLTAVKGNESNKTRTEISIIDSSVDTPLSKDRELGLSWINDPMTWQEAFAFRDKDYLQIVANGDIPRKNRNTGKWVSKEELERENTQNEKEALEELNDELNHRKFKTDESTQIEHDDLQISFGNDMPY